MDYQYYKFDGDSSYRLKQSSSFYILGIFCITIGLGWIIYIIIATNAAFNAAFIVLYIYGAVLLLSGIRICINNTMKVVINPNTKTITIKSPHKKEEQYAFSDFLSFKETAQMRYNGVAFPPIILVYRISMVFNDNGEKKAVFLNTRSSARYCIRKKADAIIAETADLLGKSVDSVTITQVP